MTASIPHDILAVPASDTASATAPAIRPVSAGNASKPPFPRPASVPTQQALQGVRFDFNDGCRVVLPEGEWHVVLRDYETDNVLFETDIGAGVVASAKKYFVPFEVQIQQRGKHADAAFIHRRSASTGMPMAGSRSRATRPRMCSSKTAARSRCSPVASRAART